MNPTRQAKEFRFVDYQVSSDFKDVIFRYSTDDFDGNRIDFSETLRLGGLDIDQATQNDPELIAILQNLHIALGINYYKPYIPRLIRLPYNLHESVANFWKEVYQNGLGEFCYLNQIDPSSIGNFIGNGSVAHLKTGATIVSSKKVLKVVSGIGGGKDSLVAIEMIKTLPNVRQSGFICESVSTNNPLRREVAKATGLNTDIFTRIPDPKLAVIRSSGNVYRGHTPASVIIAWTGILCCKLVGADYFIVANENSSNEANVRWKGRDINHQWTKTSAFERNLGALLEEQGVSIGYFSIVRPLNELLISQFFAAKCKQYFHSFFSCNQGSSKKDGLWCGHCAKCASSTLLLAPFMPIDQLVKIIGRNMLDDESLISTFEELLGISGIKPFDCVCTRDEALLIVKSLTLRGDYKNLVAVKSLADKIESSDTDWDATRQSVYKLNEADLPKPFLNLVTKIGSELQERKILK